MGLDGRLYAHRVARRGAGNPRLRDLLLRFVAVLRALGRAKDDEGHG